MTTPGAATTVIILLQLVDFSRGAEGPPMLEAYDCDDPRELRDVTNTRTENCHQLTTINHQENATYQILQTSHTTRTTGYICRMVQTRTPNYCGTYDHQTMLPLLKQTEIPKSLSPDVCRRMIRERKFTTARGDDVYVREDEVTTYFYEYPGKTYVSDEEVKCMGERWRVGDVDYESMVVSYEVKLTLQKETFVSKKGQIKSTTQGLNLPCQSHEGACQTSSATYIWNVNESTCPMAYTRTSSGITVQDREGREVFMSTDGSLIRLVLGATVSSCGEIVRQTNYDHIYIYSGKSARFQQRPVDPADVNMVTYINNRDDYLYNHLLNQVEKEMNGVLQYSCRQRAALYQPALQITKADVTTYSLGNGTFATQAGETLWTYKCRLVMVSARETPSCYMQIPVVYEGANKQLHGNKKEFYLEPFSRKLVADSIPIQCNDKLHSKYMTRLGKWIMTTPKILDAKPPEPSTSEQARSLFDRETDWSQGGVYTTEELKAMKDYIELSRYKDILSYKLTDQYQGSLQSDVVRPGQLFPNDPGFQVLTKGLLSCILEYVHSFGKGASIFLGLYMITNFFSHTMQAIYRILVLREVHGFTTQLWLCCCPDVMRTRRYRDDYKLSREARKAVPMTPLPPPPPMRNSSLDATTSTLRVPTLNLGVISPNILRPPPRESSVTLNNLQG